MVRIKLLFQLPLAATGFSARRPIHHPSCQRLLWSRLSLTTPSAGKRVSDFFYIHTHTHIYTHTYT